MKLANLHIFLETHDEASYQDFYEACKQLKEHGAVEYSISPMREYGSYGEIYVTLQIDENRLTELLEFMSDGWDGPEDECMATSFTSKVFYQSINTIYFTMYE